MDYRALKGLVEYLPSKKLGKAVRMAIEANRHRLKTLDNPEAQILAYQILKDSEVFLYQLEDKHGVEEARKMWNTEYDRLIELDK
jgi:hypothetical protein